MNGTADPVFHEAFVVPCQGPRDAVALEVFFGGGETGQQPLLAIGELVASMTHEKSFVNRYC